MSFLLINVVFVSGISMHVCWLLPIGLGGILLRSVVLLLGFSTSGPHRYLVGAFSSAFSIVLLEI